jgi:integrase
VEATVRVHLTDKRVAAIKPPTNGKRKYVHDDMVSGLLVCVTRTGSMTYMLQSRYPGKQATRRALGKPGKMSIDEAREKARAWHQLLDRHIDPAVQAEKDRLQALRAQGHSFLSVAEAYFANVERKGLVKARTIRLDITREFISRWADRNIADVSQTDIAAVINATVARGRPSQAHDLFDRARALWQFAIGCGAYGLEVNPCDRLRPKDLIGAKKPRTRVLSNAELRLLWAAIEKEHAPWQQMYKMLVLSAQRLTDVSDASWNEFDFQARTWTIPASRYKSYVPQTIPLTNEMIDILKSLPRFKKGCDYVFTLNGGVAPVGGLSKPAARLRERMSVPAWVVHDIRRTARSLWSSLPIEEIVRELMLGHGKRGLARVYNQWEYIEEKREGFQLWQRKLHSILNTPPTGDNVVPVQFEQRA